MLLLLLLMPHSLLVLSRLQKGHWVLSTSQQPRFELDLGGAVLANVLHDTAAVDTLDGGSGSCRLHKVSLPQERERVLAAGQHPGFNLDDNRAVIPQLLDGSHTVHRRNRSSNSNHL